MAVTTTAVPYKIHLRTWPEKILKYDVRIDSLFRPEKRTFTHRVNISNMFSTGIGKFQICSPSPYRVAARAMEAETSVNSPARMMKKSSTNRRRVMYARQTMRRETTTPTSTIKTRLTCHIVGFCVDLSLRS
ncbi:hypothetical protein NEUTE1DRAFT_35768 [Neurospora tetrasperma FGSC 2508]|uniref:Uncharacterized protein n=1 Tax=Neurospora tetrasperma (strain FGSC 2508 / ATCC MYA-4615 / P0657) TaxID=510951 RepID=F8MF21_NEUT8|nr:uncharacterized protein NEUTE1DRAFT_35768 [Neurospora tetrasperma FGSC 2508]EGO60073.1 hypothetical protein NEUTE1DRAFT_35768 [Neurospora tetrasperma FGSC 2508]EGZ75976.1 hypothetical protein NEUTE2DRAFT_126920 [Neurospora tetrasperma FGSC 2509]